MKSSSGSATLRKYLGLSPFDKRKKALLADKIDLGKWNVNMQYITLNVRRFMDNVSGDSDLSSEERLKKRLIGGVTPLVAVLSEGLESGSLHQPMDFTRECQAWFIAAYPDVVEYFYPYAIDSYNKNQSEVKSLLADLHKRQGDAEAHMEAFASYVEANYPKLEHLTPDDALLLLKGCYVTLGKKLLLATDA